MRSRSSRARGRRMLQTEDPAPPVEVVTAAVKRSAARAAKLAENKEKAAAGAPRAVHATMEREEGRRAVRRWDGSKALEH